VSRAPRHGKPTGNRADRDPGDDQHRGTGHARPACARAVIATLVGTFFPALVNAVPVGFLHNPIVWAVIEGVDVVADNAARLWVSLRTGLCALLVVAVAALLAATPQRGICCPRIHRRRRRFVSRSTRGPET
jgi:hypothetical protein